MHAGVFAVFSDKVACSQNQTIVMFGFDCSHSFRFIFQFTIQNYTKYDVHLCKLEFYFEDTLMIIKQKFNSR